MLFGAVTLFYMPLIVNGNILCGSYVSGGHFGVCTCTTLRDGLHLQADCTKLSWLRQLPSFSTYILQLITLIDMSGTMFCHSHSTSLKTTAHNKTILCRGSTTGELLCCINILYIYIYIYIIHVINNTLLCISERSIKHTSNMATVHTTSVITTFTQDDHNVSIVHNVVQYSSSTELNQHSTMNSLSIFQFCVSCIVLLYITFKVHVHNA